MTKLTTKKKKKNKNHSKNHQKKKKDAQPQEMPLLDPGSVSEPHLPLRRHSGRNNSLIGMKSNPQYDLSLTCGK